MVLAAVSTMVASASASGAAERSPAKLLPMTRAQVTAAGAAGTGCAFLSLEGAVLFAAADDRAAVRLRTGVVMLRAAEGASELFPFTFDRWTGGGLSVVVRPRGRAVRRGGESLRRQADLSVTARGRTFEIRGKLDCGS